MAKITIFRPDGQRSYDKVEVLSLKHNLSQPICRSSSKGIQNGPPCRNSVLKR